jgi:hypothetical protein
MEVIILTIVTITLIKHNLEHLPFIHYTGRFISAKDCLELTGKVRTTLPSKVKLSDINQFHGL